MNYNQIVIDKKIRHGKPFIRGTRITVEEILGALAGGMNYEEIQKEYGVSKEGIVAAIRYTAAWIKGEEIRPLTRVYK